MLSLGPLGRGVCGRAIMGSLTRGHGVPDVVYTTSVRALLSFGFSLEGCNEPNMTPIIETMIQTLCLCVYEYIYNEYTVI